MSEKVSIKWAGKDTYESIVQGHKIHLDGDKLSGPTPKPLILTALAGCSAIDVVSILNKMRVAYDALEVDAAGTLSDETPKYYHKIHLTYSVSGKEIDPGKVEKAVKLSLDKYCGVAAQLSGKAEITWEVQIKAPVN